MTDIGPADLQACGDVFDWLAENADSLPTENAIEMLQAARAVQAKLKTAIDMLETQALNTIEQPVLIGRTAWSKRPSMKKRPDQRMIRNRVIELAIQPDSHGEVPAAADVAEIAAGLMATLYVSPSTVPKTSGVELLGLTMADVTREEHTGFELRHTEID